MTATTYAKPLALISWYVHPRTPDAVPQARGEVALTVPVAPAPVVDAGRGFVLLRSLLRRRHWQSYATFCREYDKAAKTIDADLAGSYPSRAQLHRWLSGGLKGLPYPHHCEVLEAMFPGYTAAQIMTVVD